MQPEEKPAVDRQATHTRAQARVRDLTPTPPLSPSLTTLLPPVSPLSAPKPMQPPLLSEKRILPASASSDSEHARNVIPRIAAGEMARLCMQIVGSTTSETDYWTVQKEGHKMLVHAKIIFANNAETAVSKYIDANMSIKDIKSRILTMRKSARKHDGPITLRVQIGGAVQCRMLGIGISKVMNGDGSRTHDAFENEKQDDKSFKQVLAEFQPVPYLVGHDLVDQNENRSVTLHWTTIR